MSEVQRHETTTGPIGLATKASEVTAPLDGATSGWLTFTTGASHVILRAGPEGADLFRAQFAGQEPRVQARDGRVTIEYSRFWPFDWFVYALRQPSADVALNPSIPWRIDVRGGLSGLTADLRGLSLASIDTRGGASKVELQLDRPAGTVPLRFGGGASNLAIYRPGDIPVRLNVRGGISCLTIDDHDFGAIGGGFTWESPGYAGAGDRYDISIHGGASQITVATA